jgi:hypothetical protein
MARPKPYMPLKNRHTRMNDLQFAKFRELGGPSWLRVLLDTEIQKQKQERKISSSPFQSVWRHLN